jgi:hypothetical protein
MQGNRVLLFLHLKTSLIWIFLELIYHRLAWNLTTVALRLRHLMCLLGSYHWENREGLVARSSLSKVTPQSLCPPSRQRAALLLPLDFIAITASARTMRLQLYVNWPFH